jgi:DNA gyrase subunit A
MRLAKLTGLEIDKLEEELREVRAFIAELRGILESRDRRMEIMKGELLASREKYGDERRTEITSDEGEFTIEDLIAEEDMVVTVSHTGYIKRTSVSHLPQAAPRRARAEGGGRPEGRDFIEQLYVASTHDYILIFTDDGRCFWLKVHEIPQAGAHARQADRQPDQRHAGHAHPRDRAGARVPRRRVPALLHQATARSRRRRSRSTRTRARTASRRSRSRRATR